jgi:hypothetical protein
MKALFAVLGFCLFLTPIKAQDNTVTLSLSGAYDITVPSDWEISSKTDTGYYWTTDDSIVRVRTYTPYFLQDVAGFSDAESSEILEWVITELFEVRTFDAEQIETFQAGAYTSYGYQFQDLEEGSSIAYQLYISEIGDGTLILSYIRPQDVSELNKEDVNELFTTLGTISRRDRYVFYDGATFNLSNSTWQILEESTIGISSVNLRTCAIF